MRFTLPLLAIVAIATPAVAAADEVVTVRITTADLNLNTQEGRKALDARINAKLRKACEVESASRYSYGSKVIDRACLANARTQARAKADELAANSSRSGREVAAN